MRYLFFLLPPLLLLAPAPAFALQPEEVAVVANGYVRESMALARYYMKQRGIPQENLIRINTPDKERCSRAVYDKEIAGAVRKYLHKRGPDQARIRCLVTMFGVPLKVGPPELTREEQVRLKAAEQERDVLRGELKELESRDIPEVKELTTRIDELQQRIRVLRKEDHAAAVDSELSLVLKENYPLQGWMLNPLFVSHQHLNLPVAKEEVLLVSRLDGPTEAIVKRIIDDSLAAEAKGLQGTAYFDARWARPGRQPKPGYGWYDHSIHLAADYVRAGGRFPVVLEDTQKLFQPGEAPDAALYCGWYSLGRYVDAFQWRQGAVGYHIASSECTTLRPGGNQGWCKRMLEEGVAATVGPVAEPYLGAFPVPEVFFVTLLDGRHTLAETYFFSTAWLSWQMVLIGDPLYRPGAVRGQR